MLKNLTRRLPSLLAIRRTMALSTPSTDKFRQTPHKLLVIPGPIEIADEVLYANAHPSMSHVSPDFVPVFGDCIRMMRQVLFTKDAQPFIISASGTLGWDQVSANLIEPGDNALVLHTGYFGDSFADCLSIYGASVDQLKAPIGATVPLDTIASALQSKQYKILTFTHVDTSTGVLSDASAISALVRKVSPSTLVVVDAVCSVASEEIRFDEWGLDVVLTASQKGLGAPPGLSILVASQKAMHVFEDRKKRGVREGSYYASWGKWLPIMRAYEEGRPAYFATPPVNLIYAFRASLNLITAHDSGQDTVVSLKSRFRAHQQASQRIKAAAAGLGLKQVPLDDSVAANGMTALYFPPNITAGDLIPRLLNKGVVIAGGLHVDIKEKYFRIGHMGISVVEPSRGDIDTIISSLDEALQEVKEEKGLTV